MILHACGGLGLESQGQLPICHNTIMSFMFQKILLICCILLIAASAVFLFMPSGPKAIRTSVITDPILEPFVEQKADAVDANRKEPKFRMELGMTYEGAGLNDLAEKTYLQYTELFPGRVIGWYRLAIVRHKQGQMKEAIEALKKAADRAPARMDAPHWQLAFWLIDSGDIEKAKEQIDISNAKNPNTMQVLIAKGRIALEENKPLVAIDLLNNDKLIREVPDGYVYQLLGRAYRAIGDQDSSRDAWAKAGQKKPNWADPWTHHVVNHMVGLNVLRNEIMQNMQANNLSQVRQLIDEYNFYDNTNRVVRRIDASWYAKQGDLELSVKKFNALMNEDPSDTITAVLLVKLRMQIVQFQTPAEIAVTEKILENVLRIAPDNARAKQLLSDLQQ